MIRELDRTIADDATAARGANEMGIHAAVADMLAALGGSLGEDRTSTGHGGWPEVTTFTVDLGRWWRYVPIRLTKSEPDGEAWTEVVAYVASEASGRRAYRVGDVLLTTEAGEPALDAGPVGNVFEADRGLGYWASRLVERASLRHRS